MRIGLISFHNAYNYGAALQAYGLQRAVELLGEDCEYLDYVNEYRSLAYDLKRQCADALRRRQLPKAAKALVGMPVLRKRGKKFDAFYRQYLKTSAKRYRTAQELEEVNGQYDKFIVGSDQVWNYSHNGNDPAYLLSFVKDDARKLSYSSSFGLDSIPEELREEYAKYLRAFNRLAVRERAGVEIVRQTAQRDAHLVLDPVFLLSAEQWRELKAPQSKKKKPYVFFYTNRDSQIRDFRQTGYDFGGERHILSTHIKPGELVSPRTRLRISMSPQEFLSEIDGAELVVTASFHCMAFAILFRKQFCVFLTGDQGKDERVTSLLKLAGLEDRVVDSATGPDRIAAAIDYDAVHARLRPYLEDSRAYLKNAVFDLPDIALRGPGDGEKLFCRDKRCVGCTACASVCPHGAIRMRTDEEGFDYPALDETKCVRCGLCRSVCPVFRKTETPAEQAFYAVKNTDEIRAKSSSGGVFRALAKEVLDAGGAVCAAAMDDGFRVSHTLAEDWDAVENMGATYYVQSSLDGCFPAIRERLKTGKVLFVGTPCQVAGLKGYLRGGDPNLLTCDIVCHGVPSPGAFAQFIAMLRKKGRLEEFRFRDKSLGWKGYHVSAVIDGKKISDKLWLQSFNNLFSHNAINRPSCASCKYANYARQGDLTIGDFWGLERSHPEFLDPLGVSLVIVNTEQGRRAFSRLDLRSAEVRKEDTEQHSLLKPAGVSGSRLAVFQSLRSAGYEKTAKRFGEVSAAGAVKNLLRKVYLRNR